MAELVLWFAKSDDSIQLERTQYIDSPGIEIVAVRGKGASAYRNAVFFQWTPGVKALAVLLLTALLRHSKQIKTLAPPLEGEKGSLASSLHYALYKQPEWLIDMFGSDRTGNANLRQLLFRSNFGTGKVAISLNEELLPPNSINVYLDGVMIKDAEEIERLLVTIMKGEKEPSENNQDDQWVLEEAGSVTYLDNYGLKPIMSSVTNADNVYLFEQLEFPGSNAPKDRLLKWGWDPNFGHPEYPSVISGRLVQAKHLFEELTYLNCDERTRVQFDDWIANMTIERDGEYGRDQEQNGEIVPGFLTCSQALNFSAAFATSDLYRTYIWRDRLSGEIVATATIAPDDRGVKKKYQLDGDGFISGTNIRWDLRSRGIDKYVGARLNQHIAKFAHRQSKSTLVHAFSHRFSENQGLTFLNPLGFHQNKQISTIETAPFGASLLWSQEYKP